MVASTNHWVIFTDNKSTKKQFLLDLLKGNITQFKELSTKNTVLFSKSTINTLLEEEAIHNSNAANRPLQSMSSGEQKKHLLKHLLLSKPDVMVLDNALDHLDLHSQEQLKRELITLAKSTTTISLISRTADAPIFGTHYAYLENDRLIPLKDKQTYLALLKKNSYVYTDPLPLPLKENKQPNGIFTLKNLSVSYQDKAVLNHINWEVKKGEFWQLKGPNGSGKSTILSIITGDNPKGYGQDLTIFGHKKGSGESVWDLKQNIGYFTPSLLDRFKGYHTLENMLISGIMDSIGLYIQPTDVQKKVALSWLELLKLDHKKDGYFHKLQQGEKHLIMIARAMIKHPALLILDEPTAGLDNVSATLFSSLTNKIAAESNTAIVFVSHRTEPGLNPKRVFKLIPSPEGAIGVIE